MGPELTWRGLRCNQNIERPMEGRQGFCELTLGVEGPVFDVSPWILRWPILCRENGKLQDGGTNGRDAPPVSVFHQYPTGNFQLFPFRSGTLRTEFNPPKGLAAVSLARGSGIHSPSTTNRYSYVPGGKARALIQRPAPSGIMGVAPGRQSLKVPATEIAAAVGWLHSRVVSATGRVNSGRAGCAARPL